MIIDKDQELQEELQNGDTGGEIFLSSNVSYIMIGLVPITENSKGVIEYKIVDEWYEWEYGEVIEKQCIVLGRVKSLRHRNIRGWTRAEFKAV